VGGGGGGGGGGGVVFGGGGGGGVLLILSSIWHKTSQFPLSPEGSSFLRKERISEDKGSLLPSLMERERKEEESHRHVLPSIERKVGPQTSMRNGAVRGREGR